MAAQILKGFGGLTNMQVGLLSVLPYACGGVGMMLCGRSSDRSGDRRWHLVCGAGLAALGYAGAALAPNNTLVFVGLCVAATGMLSTFGVFWAHASDLLGGAAAAGGLAFINTASQLGGFVGPMAVGVSAPDDAEFQREPSRARGRCLADRDRCAGAEKRDAGWTRSDGLEGGGLSAGAEELGGSAALGTGLPGIATLGAVTSPGTEPLPRGSCAVGR